MTGNFISNHSFPLADIFSYQKQIDCREDLIGFGIY